MAVDGDDDEGAATERFPAPRMQGKTLVVGKTIWAVDIDWRARQDGLNAARARQAAVKDGNDLFALNGASQMGTSRTAYGHRVGMPSLALAMVEHADGSSLIGSFECGGGHSYIVAIVEGQVWPGYDNIYTNPEAKALVKDFVERRQDVPFDEVYAPDAYYLAGSVETPLAELLSTARTRRHRLQGTSRKGSYAKIAAVMAVLALGYVGYDFYTDYQMQELIKEGQREEAERRLQAERAAKLDSPIYPPMPSIAAGRGMEALAACVRFMDGIPQYNAGWESTKIECDGSTVTMTMRQTAIGTVNWLYPFIGQYKGAILDTPGEKLATATWRLDPTEIKPWGDVHGQAPAAVSRYIKSQFAEVYQSYVLAPPNRPDINTTTVGRRPVTVPAPWTTTDLELSQDHYLRDDIFDVLSRIQNLVLTGVEEDLPDRGWKVKATIFHAVPQDPATPPLQ